MARDFAVILGEQYRRLRGPGKGETVEVLQVAVEEGRRQPKLCVVFRRERLKPGPRVDDTVFVMPIERFAAGFVHVPNPWDVGLGTEPKGRRWVVPASKEAGKADG